MFGHVARINSCPSSTTNQHITVTTDRTWSARRVALRGLCWIRSVLIAASHPLICEDALFIRVWCDAVAPADCVIMTTICIVYTCDEVVTVTVRDAESLFFCGTLTPGYKILDSDPESDSAHKNLDFDSGPKVRLSSGK